MRAPLALIVALALAAPAWAYRVPSSKTVLPSAPGVRGDITVPYLTNTNTTLGVYQGVAPRIYSDPLLYPPNNPQIKPVFNLPFYGARLGPGDGMIGAQPVRPNTLRRGR